MKQKEKEKKTGKDQKEKEKKGLRKSTVKAIQCKEPYCGAMPPGRNLTLTNVKFFSQQSVEQPNWLC